MPLSISSNALDDHDASIFLIERAQSGPFLVVVTCVDGQGNAVPDVLTATSAGEPLAVAAHAVIPHAWTLTVDPANRPAVKIATGFSGTKSLRFESQKKRARDNLLVLIANMVSLFTLAVLFVLWPQLQLGIEWLGAVALFGISFTGVLVRAFSNLFATRNFAIAVSITLLLMLLATFLESRVITNRSPGPVPTRTAGDLAAGGSALIPSPGKPTAPLCHLPPSDTPATDGGCRALVPALPGLLRGLHYPGTETGCGDLFPTLPEADRVAIDRLWAATGSCKPPVIDFEGLPLEAVLPLPQDHQLGQPRASGAFSPRSSEPFHGLDAYMTAILEPLESHLPIKRGLGADLRLTARHGPIKQLVYSQLPEAVKAAGSADTSRVTLLLPARKGGLDQTLSIQLEIDGESIAQITLPNLRADSLRCAIGPGGAQVRRIALRGAIGTESDALDMDYRAPDPTLISSTVLCYFPLHELPEGNEGCRFDAAITLDDNWSASASWRLPLFQTSCALTLSFYHRDALMGALSRNKRTAAGVEVVRVSRLTGQIPNGSWSAESTDKAPWTWNPHGSAATMFEVWTSDEPATLRLTSGTSGASAWVPYFEERTANAERAIGRRQIDCRLQLKGAQVVAAPAGLPCTHRDGRDELLPPHCSQRSTWCD